jgi:hypothetical protein
MDIVLGLNSSKAAKFGSLTGSITDVVQLAFPKTLNTADLAKVKRDCEIVLDRLQKNPKAFQQIVQLTSAGKAPDARKIIKTLKLTEADFEKEGGGCWFLIGVLVILVLIYVDRKNIDW